MFKALITVALCAWVAPGLASYPQTTTPAAKSSNTENTTRAVLQPAIEGVKVRAVHSPDIRANPPRDLPPALEPADSGVSGWRSYGTLLATLVLMAVIAVRRFGAGKH